jgi:PIN domain nuclease of toxin-antitoxin system
MRYLLDTHTLIWWMTIDPQLSKPARVMLEDKANISMVSAVSAWEIATKVLAGLVQDFVDDWMRERMEILAITADHGPPRGLTARSTPRPFRPHADRSSPGSEPIVSNDRALDGYGVRRLW